MLIIYDNTNTYYQGFNSLDGEVHSLDVTIPDGYYLDKIDTTVIPHQPIFKPIPKSEVELVKEMVTSFGKSLGQISEDLGNAMQENVVNWVLGMNCVEGVLYKYDGVVYKCIRDYDGSTLHYPNQLLGIYFEEVK